MLVAGSVKIGNLTIWSKVINNYSRFITDNSYNFPYSLYFFALFFPYRSYRFNTLLIIILIFRNWYVCLILFRVLWIPRCPYNGYLCISRISCFCSFISICSLSFFFCYLLCFRICRCRSSLLFICIIMLVRLFCRK